MSYAATAGAINVTPETFNNWMNWGKSGEKEPIYCRFYALVRESESRLMHNCLTKLKKVNDTGMNPQSIQWLLERRFPDNFGKKNSVDVNAVTESRNLNLNVSATPQTWESKEQMRKEIAGFFDKLNKSRLLE